MKFKSRRLLSALASVAAALAVLGAPQAQARRKRKS